MTGKRFQIIHLGNPYDFVVKDHQTNRTYGTLQGDDKSLMELLNAFNDENEQSKSKINKLDDKLYSKECDVFDLKKENDRLKFQLNDCLNKKLFSRRQLEQENEELKQQLKPIQYFADKHGINIFNIEDAFHNCWKDNGKLVTENQELRKSSQDYEDVVNNFFLEHENDFNQELKDEITLLFDIEW